MPLEKILEKRLKSGDWKLERNGAKHNIFRHPNGSMFCLPHRLDDTGRLRQNYMKTIEQKERMKQ